MNQSPQAKEFFVTSMEPQVQFRLMAMVQM